MLGQNILNVYGTFFQLYLIYILITLRENVLDNEQHPQNIHMMLFVLDEGSNMFLQPLNNVK